MTRATLVLIAFHRPQQLRAIREMLIEADLEVIVVNVESDPEISALVGDWTEVQIPGNPGYGAAVNEGVASATNEIVVFSNDDVELSANVILELVEVIEGGGVDVVVPAIRDTNGNVQRTVHALPTLGSLTREWALLPDAPIPVVERFLKVEKWRTPSEAEPVEAASAVTVATTRALLHEVPLSDDYFMYWEEIDWFWRLRERHRRVLYWPSASVVHAGGREDLREQKARLMARNAVRCVRSTQSRVAAVAAWIIVILWNGRLVVQDALMLRSRDRLRIRMAGLGAALAAWREIR